MNKQYKTHFKNLIYIGFFKLGYAIPSKYIISIKLGITEYQVSKFIKILLNEGLLEKYHNRFYIINDNLNSDIKTIQKNLIEKAKINLFMIQLLEKGAIYNKKHIAYIIKNNLEINIYFPLRKNKIKFNILDVNEQPLEIQEIIKTHNIK